MIYFTSEQHFLHKNIIKYCNRPFEFSQDGLIKCAETIYKNYNNLIKDNDIVFFLGDVALTKSNNKEVVKQMLRTLKGHKILIRGNHDTEKDEYYKACGFEHIFNYLVLGKIFISHYELKYRGTQEEKEQYKILKECNCEFLVHGHIHNKPSSQDDIKRLNVCVDYKPNNFTPIYNETLSNYIQERLKEEKWAETLLH